MKYKIKCPKCETTFDCTKKIKRFQEDVLRVSKILDKIKELNELNK